jgi:hypothetical protein
LSAVVVDRDLYQAGARPLRRELRSIAHAGRTERTSVEHLDLGRPVPVQAEPATGRHRELHAGAPPERSARQFLDDHVTV